MRKYTNRFSYGTLMNMKRWGKRNEQENVTL
jgi:hypothetical protein